VKHNLKSLLPFPMYAVRLAVERFIRLSERKPLPGRSRLFGGSELAKLEGLTTLVNSEAMYIGEIGLVNCKAWNLP
jgi:hypothetical protein